MHPYDGMITVPLLLMQHYLQKHFLPQLLIGYIFWLYLDIISFYFSLIRHTSSNFQWKVIYSGYALHWCLTWLFYADQFLQKEDYLVLPPIVVMPKKGPVRLVLFVIQSPHRLVLLKALMEVKYKTLVLLLKTV